MLGTSQHYAELRRMDLPHAGCMGLRHFLLQQIGLIARYLLCAKRFLQARILIVVALYLGFGFGLVSGLLFIKLAACQWLDFTRDPLADIAFDAECRCLGLPHCALRHIGRDMAACQQVVDALLLLAQLL